MNFTDPTGHRPVGECEAYEACQPTSNPWKQTEGMLDANHDGATAENEVIKGMNQIEHESTNILLNSSTPPAKSSFNPYGGPMTNNNCSTTGRPPCNARHPSIDSFTGERSRGSQVYATAFGKVVAVGYADDGFGNYVIIEHNVYGSIYYSVYAHNSVNLVTVGDIVPGGSTIALMGDSHNQAIVHSHFEIRTPRNLSLDQANPFSAHVYWPSTASALQANFVDLGSIYGYHPSYNAWRNANP